MKTEKIENQDPDLEKIRHYRGTWKNFFDFWKKKGVEVDPYKGTILKYPTEKIYTGRKNVHQDFGTYDKAKKIQENMKNHINTFEEFLNESKKTECVYMAPRGRGSLQKYDKKTATILSDDGDSVTIKFPDGKTLTEVPKEQVRFLGESNINEAQKPKSWDTMFAMNAISDYEAGKFDPDDDASLANWEKDYNGGKAPKPGFETYDIIAYALLTGKKPDGSKLEESIVTEDAKETAKEIFDELISVNGEEIADMESQEAMTMLSKRGIIGGKANMIAKELLKLTAEI